MTTNLTNSNATALDPVVIVAAQRTPLGNLLGSIASLTAPQLGAIAHKAALAAAHIAASDIDEVISGCVLSAGQGQAPARQAALAAAIPDAVGATTINKMCGSGMKAVMLAHDAIMAGTSQIVLASGMESMSNAPYLLNKARLGYRLGHGALLDHIFTDGLEDAYDKGKLMGYFAEVTATKFKFSREMQDEFATISLQRAIAAQQQHYFVNEIAAVQVTTKHDVTTITTDEGANPANLAKISRLKPAFMANGSVTAANSSSISDGAASLILMRLSNATKRGIKPLAKIIAHSSHAQQPEWFTTAPTMAIHQLMEKTGWQLSHVDLFEINEAFAVVTMAAMSQLDIPHDKVNIHGGACALGHPIGASGARIIVTLLWALQQHQLQRGIAALCIGGGEATAIAVERI